MAYQFGVLTFIVIAASIAFASVVISLWEGRWEVAAGVSAVLALFYRYMDVPVPLLQRLGLLFREGVPLAPYGFRRNATLGYWLGIPLIYVGHAITALTLLLFWELMKRPVDGVPLGLGFAFAITAYSAGMGLVESSYSLWAERLDGVLPGDAGSSPLRSVVWSTAVLSILLVFLYVAEYPTGSVAHRSAGTADSGAAAQLVPGGRVDLADFIVLTGGTWTGEAWMQEDNSGSASRAPVAVRAALIGGDSLRLTAGVPGESGAPREWSFQLREGGQKLNELVVLERTELLNGELQIVAYGHDSEVQSRVRWTFLIGEEVFRLQQHVEPSAGHLVLQREYNLTRPPGSE